MKMTTETESNENEIQDLSVVRNDAVKNAEEAVERAFRDGNILLNSLDSESEDFVRYADTGMGLIASSVAGKGMEERFSQEDFLRKIDNRILMEDGIPERPYVASVAGAVFADGGYSEYSRWFDRTLCGWMDQVDRIPEDFWNMMDATGERFADEEPEEPRLNCFARFKKDMDKAMDPVGNFLKEKLTKGALLLAKSVSQIEVGHVNAIAQKIPKKYAAATIGLVIVPLILRNYKGGKYAHA